MNLTLAKFSRSIEAAETRGILGSNGIGWLLWDTLVDEVEDDESTEVRTGND